jgi:hypothetical protein
LISVSKTISNKSTLGVPEEFGGQLSHGDILDRGFARL